MPKKCSLKKKLKRVKKPLEFIHMDVCNPIHPNSLGKKKYFLLFIDDFSRKTLVYFLKKKYKAFSTFKKFTVLIENESDHNIKTMRSKKWGKFTSKAFEEYCENHGICWPLMISYPP